MAMSAVDRILSLMAPGYLRDRERDERTRAERELRLAKLRAKCEANPHGTRARYSAGRCRCMLCRAANSRYECARALARRNGASNGIVSAARAREHLADLSAKGIGRHSVQEACDVSDGILFSIISGERKNIRAETERRILSVDEGARRGKCLVSAAPTWKLLRELIRDGYSKKQLAQWMGYKRSIQFNRRRITAASAARVERMCALLRAGKLKRNEVSPIMKTTRREL